MDNDPNPYATPTSLPGLSEAQPSGESRELASRLTRFAARFIDGLIGTAISMPVMFLTGYIDRAFKNEVGLVEIGMYTLGGFVVYLALHGYFIATRGQTLGKMAVGIKMVDNDSGELVPFVKIIGLRDLPVMVASVIPCLGGLLVLVDILFIFGAEQRCIHDLLAGTKVVEA